MLLVIVSSCCFLSFLVETIKKSFDLFLYLPGLDFRSEYINLEINGLPS
jgi:hypothetical protein